MSDSLAIFTKASQLLAEADTLQKAKELKHLALTAAEWAKRKGMGEAAIQHCRSYALEAERKMGEMLRETERAKANQHTKKKSAELPDVTEQPTLAELNITKRESAEAQKLAALPMKRFEALKAGETTKKQAFNPVHVSNNSGENEWYTPAPFIAAAREAMGGIDCDPASSEVANKTVESSEFFTKEQDGLAKKWKGRVWLNPPYAQPLIAQFAEAVAAKFKSGEIDQACILVNNATETAWFVGMVREASAICFPTTRVKFLDPSGKPSGAPLQGQAIIYMGAQRKTFKHAFDPFGPVLWTT